MEILPSEEFWKSVGFENPKKIIGNINGPRSRAGISGWAKSEFKEILKYCGDQHIYSEVLTRTALFNNIKRRSEKTIRFLALLDKYSTSYPISVIRKVASGANIETDGVSRKSLVLKMFLKDKDLLVTAYYLSLGAGRQMVHSYFSETPPNKTTVISPSYKNRLSLSLKKTVSFEDKDFEIKRVETKREDPIVKFYIKHEKARQYMPLMKEKDSHWDKPTRWTTITINTKSGMLEVKTPILKMLGDIKNSVSETTFGDKEAFYPLSSSIGNSERMNELSKDLLLVSQTLKSIEVQDVGIVGNPNIKLSGIDIVPTIEYLKKQKQIDLTKEIVTWECNLVIQQKGQRIELKVTKPKDNSKKRSDFIFEPRSVPSEVKEFVYILFSKGMIPKYTA